MYVPTYVDWIGVSDYPPPEIPPYYRPENPVVFRQTSEDLFWDLDILGVDPGARDPGPAPANYWWLLLLAGLVVLSSKKDKKK